MSELRPDICVVGAGSAGLTVAAAAASFGHDVVLVERALMGGDCLNFGCVPSKSLIAAARHAHAAREGARFGVHAQPTIDYGAVHAHVHGVIAAIAPIDSVERFEGLGVTVLKASARFVDGRTIEAGSARIKPKRTVLATGSKPLMPPIDGLEACAPLTNESVFDLTRLPRRLAVIGGGPIGCELGQAFARLGSDVTILSREPILAREDEAAVAVVRASLLREGIVLHEAAQISACRRTAAGVEVRLRDGHTIVADELLVAAGRTPVVEDLDLDAAGIEHDASGIKVDAGLRTTNRRVYAIGDTTGGLQFTHVAGHQASLAVRAIVFRLPVAYDPDTMPRVTYTAPELAQVGLTEAEAKRRDRSVEVSIAQLAENDRAQTERVDAGFVKLVSRRGKLLGATIVGPHAGEIAATYALALAAKVPMKTIASFTPAYPTLSEAGKRAAVNHFAPRFRAPWVRRTLALLKRLP